MGSPGFFITLYSTGSSSPLAAPLQSVLFSIMSRIFKVGLVKLNIQKTNIMASSPITSWQIDRESVTDFIFLGSKITVDGDCSHEIKTLIPWKKSYDKPWQCMKKQRHFITLPTKVRIVKAMVFPVVMYGCESWIIKKAECWRIDAFELWCWRKLLRIPWTARRPN